MLRHINERGGIVVYTKNLIENLLAIDKKNQYIFFYNDASLIGAYARYTNVKEMLIETPTKLLWDQVAIPRAVKREEIDLIFNPKLSIPLFAPCPKIFTLHGLEQFALPALFRWYDRMYFRIMMPLFCRRAEAIVVMTKAGKADLIKYLKVAENKIRVIYEAGHKRFKLSQKRENLLRIRERYNLPEKYIFFIGGITPLKNFSNIIKAFKCLREKISIKLVIAGFKRWKYSKDMELINQLDLGGEIINLGFIPDEDLPYLYNSAECLLFPSLYEGFGIPILEAQASGCPVITSKTGCTPEVSGRAALLVNPYDYKEIAFALDKLLNNSDLKNGLIAAGLKNAENFSWRKTAEQILELFNDKINKELYNKTD